MTDHTEEPRPPQDPINSLKKAVGLATTSGYLQALQWLSRSLSDEINRVETLIRRDSEA